MSEKQVKLIITLFLALALFFAKKVKSQSFIKPTDHFRLYEFPLRFSEDMLPNDLKNYGIYYGINFANDFLYNVSGGIKTGPAYIGLFYPNINIDFNKMFGWREANMYISAIGNIGDNFNKKIGTEQGVDNIAAFNTWKIYEFWIEQMLLNNNLSLKLGLYDLNTEFDVRLSSLVFLDPSQAIGPEFSLTGKNGPSIFPTTSVAFRVKYQNNAGFYFQSAILDGVPGDPNNPAGTHIIFNKKYGLLLAGETGYVNNKNGFSKSYEKFFLGAWYYTSKFEKLQSTDIQGNPGYQEGNYGIYLSAEKFLWSKTANPNEGLAAFLRIGISNKNVNMIDGYLGFGINYTGIIPGREQDEFGIAFASAHNSSKYIEQMLLESINISKYESIIEMTYLYYLNNWLSIQPDLQYVFNPANCQNNDYSFIAGIRMILTL